VKQVESTIFIDNSSPMTRHEGVVEYAVDKLRTLIEDFGAVLCVERTVSSVLHIFTNPEILPRVRPEEGVVKLVFCLTNSECEDGTSRMLIEHGLATLPPNVYFIFTTVATDDSTKVWFEYLINKHPAHGEKFAVMREYAEESIEDEFARCVRQLLEH